MLICRNYKGDVDMAEIDHFMHLLMQHEEEGLLCPVLSHGNVHFMWIKYSNLYRILVSLISLFSECRNAIWPRVNWILEQKLRQKVTLPQMWGISLNLICFSGGDNKQKL